MTTGTVRTQGTEIYFAHTLASDPELVKLLCPTGVTGVGSGAKDQIETTCLDTVGDKEYAAGLGGTSPVNVPFNFIRTSGAQQALTDLKRDGTVIPWIVLLSDGTTAPTLDTDGAIVAPSGDVRTSVEFSGYVSEVNFDIGTNEIVRGTLVIQRSGSETWHFPTPV